MRNFGERVKEILTSSLPRREKARALAGLVQQARGFHWVGLYDVSPSEISAIAWTGESAPAFPTFPITKGINGAAVAGRRPVMVQDVTKDSRYLTTFGDTKAEAIFPVISDEGRVVGTIDVESDRVNAFGTEEEVFLTMCSTLLAPLWNAEQLAAGDVRNARA
jgi:L-methionine (R)-S-oxide reductase